MLLGISSKSERSWLVYDDGVSGSSLIEVLNAGICNQDEVLSLNLTEVPDGGIFDKCKTLVELSVAFNAFEIVLVWDSVTFFMKYLKISEGLGKGESSEVGSKGSNKVSKLKEVSIDFSLSLLL